MDRSKEVPEPISSIYKAPKMRTSARQITAIILFVTAAISGAYAGYNFYQAHQTQAQIDRMLSGGMCFTINGVPYCTDPGENKED